MNLSSNNPAVLPLWPDGSPNNEGGDKAMPGGRPSIEVYHPSDRGAATDALRPAVIICPGGGYGGRAQHEGAPFAWLFAARGMVGVVCHYRVKPNTFPAPHSDAARAIRVVRENAAAWGVDPDRIALMGFSAGGHLASLVGTQPHCNIDEHDDLADAISARPDRLILAYPVISMVDEYHEGSAANLLGPDADEATRTMFSNDLQVDGHTPSTFIFHTAEDPGVKVSNAVKFATACWANGIDAALHVYAKGPHGVGMGLNHPGLGGWTDVLLDWLADWRA